MTNHIHVELAEQIATVTLSRPHKLNAINPEMMASLAESIADLNSNVNIRAVIITGAGDRAFSAGADIKAWAALEPVGMWRHWIPNGSRVLKQLALLPQPVIAAVNGVALGGGMELALACDLRIASETAIFAMPEVSIGTVPGWGGTYRLPEIVGPARAKSMILTGQRIDAGTALDWGLITEVAPANKLEARARELAEKIAANAPLAVTMAKQLIDNKGAPEHMEAMAGALGAYSEDGKEGVLSFKEKRAPRYKGK